MAVGDGSPRTRSKNRSALSIRLLLAAAIVTMLMLGGMAIIVWQGQWIGLEHNSKLVPQQSADSMPLSPHQDAHSDTGIHHVYRSRIVSHAESTQRAAQPEHQVHRRAAKQAATVARLAKENSVTRSDSPSTRISAIDQFAELSDAYGHLDKVEERDAEPSLEETAHLFLRSGVRHRRAPVLSARDDSTEPSPFLIHLKTPIGASVLSQLGELLDADDAGGYAMDKYIPVGNFLLLPKFLHLDESSEEADETDAPKRKRSNESVLIHTLQHRAQHLVQSFHRYETRDKIEPFLC
jgi:hypothetical protein